MQVFVGQDELKILATLPSVLRDPSSPQKYIAKCIEIAQSHLLNAACEALDLKQLPQIHTNPNAVTNSFYRGLY